MGGMKSRFAIFYATCRPLAGKDVRSASMARTWFSRQVAERTGLRALKARFIKAAKAGFMAPPKHVLSSASLAHRMKMARTTLGLSVAPEFSAFPHGRCVGGGETQKAGTVAGPYLATMLLWWG